MDIDNGVIIYFCVGAVVVITLYIIGMCIGKKYLACCKDDPLDPDDIPL